MDQIKKPQLLRCPINFCWSSSLSEGATGAELREAMRWAIGQGKLVQTTEQAVKDIFCDLASSGAVHQLKLSLQNWTGSGADTCVA